MNPKICLWLMGLASFLALVSLAAILWFFSPQNAGWPILILLFLSLFLALCGFFSLIGFWLRRRKNGQEQEVLVIALREGVLLSGLLVSFMVLKALNIFWWWSALIFLVIVVAIEIAFLSKQD
jgi:O-antigen/teichoic acid export membrane protein